MGTTLTGTTPATTYDSLIKVTDNGPIGTSLKTLTDGLGNDSALALSTKALQIKKTDTIQTSAGCISHFSNDYIYYFGGTAGIVISDFASTARLQIYNNNAIGFETGTTERMRITSTGAVGIGTSSPTATLNIKATANNNSNNLAQVLTNSEFRLQYRADDVSSLYIGGLGSEKGFLQGVNAAQNAGADISLNPYGGNVGIGTTAPESTLHVAGSAAGSNVTLYIDNAAGATLNNSSRLKFSSDSGSSVSSGGAELNCLVVNAVNGAVDLIVKSWTGTVYTEKARFLAGGGLTFNGDTAAANALDDYEEGTFTATITPATSGTITSGATFTTWTYTKIGRQVTINGVFVISSVASPVGANVVIGGLPFTIFNNNGAYGAFSAAYFTSATSANSAVAGRHSINTTQLTLGVDASTVAASDEIYVTATYFV